MKNNLKKLISLFLALVITLSLTACGDTKNEIKAAGYKFDIEKFAYYYCLVWEGYEYSAFYAEANYGSGNGMTLYGYDYSLLPHEQSYIDKYSSVTEVTVEDLCIESPTWEDVLVYLTFNNLIGMEYAFEEAKNRGITLEDTQSDRIDENVEKIKIEAENVNLSFEDYLLGRYGASLTEEEYREIFKESNLYDNAIEKLKEAYKDEVTEEEKQTEYEANKEKYDELGDSNMGDVRHILVEFPRDSETDKVLPVTDNEKADYLKKAQDILALHNENPTEDNFVRLVKEYSADTASVENGGLYTNVIKDGTFVSEFEDWAVNPSRKVGDVEIIETRFGYHIMYFAETYGSARDYYITEAAATDKFYKDYRAATKEKLKKIDFRRDDIKAITDEQKALFRALISIKYKIAEK